MRKKEKFRFPVIIFIVILFLLPANIVFAQDTELATTTDTVDSNNQVVPATLEEEIPETTQQTIENPEIQQNNLQTNDIEQLTETPILKCRTHIQDIGWSDWQEAGDVIGTIGESKRLEAIEFQLINAEGNAFAGISIEYRVYIQYGGWQGWEVDGELAGTSGKSLRIEAIQIRLTGENASQFELYYQSHIQDFSWLGWCAADQASGSTGFGKRMEALRVKILSAESVEKPDTNTQGFIRTFSNSELSYSAHIQNSGNVPPVNGGSTLGTTGQSIGMEGITIDLQHSLEVLNGSIQYSTHIQDMGWGEFVSQGSFNGTFGQNKRMEAIKISLTGSLGDFYDIYYRAHVQNYGWLGWAKNGQIAGTIKCSYRMEALQIQLVPKNDPAPGVNAGYYKEVPLQVRIGSFSTRSTNTSSGTYNMTKALLCFNGIILQPGEILSFNATTGYCGKAQGYLLAGVVGGMGYGGGICQASTTLYGAAIRAGLGIIERSNHSYSSTYVPRGLDAMVNWGTSDLKIVNNYSTSVKIVTYTIGATLYAEVYGQNQEWFDDVDVQSWNTGVHSTSAIRIYYKNGKEVRRESLRNSYYKN